MKRRDVLRLGLAGGAGLIAARRALGQVPGQPPDPNALLDFLCPPDGEPPDLVQASPPADPFVAELFVPPVRRPVPLLDPPPDPRAHQRYEEFPPKKLYELHEQEFLWRYHPAPPYGAGSVSWGFDGSTPGPTFHARYGEPVLVRRFNDLPPVGVSRVGFALPSTTTHLHNGHTASESDGNPQDWIDSGEFWDHHYANFPAGFDPREKLTTLWYHDHRLDFTAANVYAGLDGFYLLFDEQDSGDENDTNPGAFRLPSGKYDVPLILHDVMFDAAGQVRWNPFNTDGILGDRFTVNRRIQPHFYVERRKYRFRLLNGGPSRFYQIFLSSGLPLVLVTSDGNFLPEPVETESVYVSVAQRYDVIIDFSRYRVGERVRLINRLEQTNGRGPSGRLLDPGDPLIEFRVVEATGRDGSRIPDRLRELPPIDMSLVKQKRTWVFDYQGGLWTINGMVMDPNRVDAGIEQGSAEIWTLRNGGSTWSHPIHSHFTEFQFLEINGKPFHDTVIEDLEGRREKFVEYLGRPKAERRPIKRYLGGQRRDVATLLPGDEVKVYMRWSDFLGKHVLHCHNVVHEDHSMMIRWDIVEPGRGFTGSRPASQVYGTEPVPPHLEPRPANATSQDDQSEGSP